MLFWIFRDMIDLYKFVEVFYYDLTLMHKDKK